MSTHKLRTVSVVEAIAEQISEEIFSGMLQPGEVLVETQLAERFEVPRQTIRSAIVVLMHDGILRREPNKSVYIPQFSESRSEEHTSELQSLMRISYAVFCLKKKIRRTIQITHKPFSDVQHEY